MTEPSSPPETPERFAPRAAGAMADMFDHVSPRYDFLNRLMTLGRDAAWRAAMWRAVPGRARVVLDLCTGNGVSLEGLRRPGRLVIGADVSLGMLAYAQDQEGRVGWAPRLVCADAFPLPLRFHTVAAVTIAFGLRNLRPRPAALAEIARVLAPGGTLVILEGTPPEPGPFAPFHRFHLRHVVPLLGRLSPDPSAYAYLGQSILAFGPASEVDRELQAAGFEITAHQTFMLGAARLWVARRTHEKVGEAGATSFVHSARARGPDRGDMPNRHPAGDWEWRIASATQLVVCLAVLVSLVVALVQLSNAEAMSFLTPGQRLGGIILSIAGIAGFALRALALSGRLLGSSNRR